MDKQKSELGKWAQKRAENLRKASTGLSNAEELVASNIEDGAYHLASVIKSWLNDNPRSTRNELLEFIRDYCGKRRG